MVALYGARTDLSQGHNQRMAQAALVLDLPPHIQLVVLHEVPSRQELDGHLQQPGMSV